MNRAILILVMTILSLPIFAQSKLTGTVVDGATGETLIGASIVVQGTGTGGVTDLDGHFSIDLPKDKTKVVVSSVGYTSVTIQFRPSCNQTKNPEVIPGIFCIGMAEVV